MQLNKLLKGLLVAVPVMTLAACSSSSNLDENAGNETNQVEQPTETVVVETMEVEKSPEEIMREKYEALRQDNLVYFAFDSSLVQGEYADMLQAHADFLIQNPSVNVILEGNTDKRGTPEYNIALGESRGQSVERYLRSLGVPASQMSVVSYGEEKPLVRGDTEEAFAKNRRVALVY